MRRARKQDGARAVRAPVDWPSVYQRLDRLRLAIEREWVPDVQEQQRILRARADVLARPRRVEGPADSALEVIEFSLAYERYAIESAFVREVFPLTDLTRLPCTPPFVLGVVNVRGEIVSVVDLKKFFDLPERGLTNLNKLLVLDARGMVFGVLADEVIGVRSIPAGELQDFLPTLSGIRLDYLKGIAGDRLVVLDAAALLEDPRMVVHEVVED